MPPVPGNDGAITSSKEEFTTATNVTLNWAEATDDITPKAELEYRVYRSAENDIQGVADAEANGEALTEFEAALTSAKVDLLSGKHNYFNVVVRDAAGNEASYTVVPISFGEADSCTKNSDCFSGSCRISYRDRDGDNYGDDNTKAGRCDGSIPAGYAAQDGDCCDDGSDLEIAAKIHPGASAQSKQANVCGIDWDYDCSGRVTAEAIEQGCASDASKDNDCKLKLYQPSTSECGDEDVDAGSCYWSDFFDDCWTPQIVGTTVECR